MPTTTERRDRKIKAGVYLYHDPQLSQKKALIRAGYSPNTAAKPTVNGLSAERCLEAAAEAGAIPSSATIRDTARSAFQKKVRKLATDERALDKARAGELARVLDVAERWHGAGQDEQQARTLDARLSALERLQRILDRGTPQDDVVSQQEGDDNPSLPPSKPQSTTDT